MEKQYFYETTSAKMLEFDKIINQLETMACTEKAKEKDLFKDRAFKAAGIPLKRIRDYDEAAVRKLFKEY